MIFTDIHKLLPHLVFNKRIMGLDLGEKKIGIAFSDRCHIVSSPYSVYKRRNMSKDLGHINSLFRRQDCTAIVMGFPENHEEKDREWIEKIFLFTKKISKRYMINIYIQDETFSTKEAFDMLSFLSKKKINKIDDKISASCILDRTLTIIQKLY